MSTNLCREDLEFLKAVRAATPYQKAIWSAIVRRDSGWYRLIIKLDNGNVVEANVTTDTKVDLGLGPVRKKSAT